MDLGRYIFCLSPFSMIELNKLNGKPFMINPLLIEQMQGNPDTTITLSNGKLFVVQNSIEEVNDKVLQFYRSIQILGRKELLIKESDDEE